MCAISFRGVNSFSSNEPRFERSMTIAAEKHQKVAVIAGAGPAGLTAALELLRRSNITPIVFEADSQVGGISRRLTIAAIAWIWGGTDFFRSRTG